VWCGALCVLYECVCCVVVDEVSVDEVCVCVCVCVCVSVCECECECVVM